MSGPEEKDPLGLNLGMGMSGDTGSSTPVGDFIQAEDGSNITTEAGDPLVLE